jgi:transcriptional regulator with XRE-family HTH domain
MTMRGHSLIREARLRAGLTQHQLAERAGTRQSAIARWESGRTRPPVETVAQLVRACGLELAVSLRDGDPAERSLIERNLSLSPAQRLDQLRRAVAFNQAGRAALARRR